MLVFITTSGIAAAATADSDEQMTDGAKGLDANNLQFLSFLKSYEYE